MGAANGRPLGRVQQDQQSGRCVVSGAGAEYARSTHSRTYTYKFIRLGCFVCPYLMFRYRFQMQHDVKEIAVFGSASEGFSQKNIGCSIAESLERFEDVVSTALDHGIKVRGYISCVCGCPYDGAVSPQDVAKVVEIHNSLMYEIFFLRQKNILIFYI